MQHGILKRNVCGACWCEPSIQYLRTSQAYLIKFILDLALNGRLACRLGRL